MAMATPMNGHNGKKRYVSPSDSILSPVSLALRRRKQGGAKAKPKRLVARKLVARPAPATTGAGAAGAKAKPAAAAAVTRAKGSAFAKYRVLPKMSPPSLSITKALLAQKANKKKVAPSGHRTPMSKKAAAQKGKRHSALGGRGVKPRTPLGVANR